MPPFFRRRNNGKGDHSGGGKKGPKARATDSNQANASASTGNDVSGAGAAASPLAASSTSTAQALKPAAAGSSSSSNNAQSFTSGSGGRTPHTCNACRQPILSSETHIHTNRPLSGDRRYHKQCFVCLHCQAPIDPKNQPFCFDKKSKSSSWRSSNDSNNSLGSDVAAAASATAVAASASSNNSSQSPRQENDEQPFHRECFAEYFGWKCVVCEQSLPVTGPDPNIQNEDGTKKTGSKFEFLKHPFFEKERMCPHHARPKRRSNGGEVSKDASAESDSVQSSGTDNQAGEIRRCAGCHRFEPLFASPNKHFIDVGDSDTGRCVCLACCRTVVTTSEDAISLWEKVVNFFEGPLGLITDVDSCNGVSRKTLLDIPILLVGSEALNDNLREYSRGVHYGSSQIMTRGLCLSEHSTICEGSIGVTAVMCLSGLPADLTASILAHEATHAWVKLHPNFRYSKPLPLKVEEGLCQLIAFLFLNDGLDPLAEEGPPTKEDDSTPSDAKLRQYFKFCIETDESIYGEGFRLAARAYALMGMQELLYYVALNHDFPVD